MSPLSLQQWLDYLLTLHNKEIDLGLERVRKVAEELDVLRPAPFVITVAGTNGKGSSVAMLVSIIRAAGYRVGQYTSPHILKFNERIQIDGDMVSDETLVAAFQRVEEARKQVPLTYFEFTTLAALECFGNEALDCVVLEVGLGGRLDAVNIVDADATLITAIDIDHSDWLGDNREAIGYEKAGVMRPDQLSVCSDPRPPKSLLDFAQRHHVNLKRLGVDFHYKKESTNHQAWCFCNTSDELYPYPNLQGDFQIQNASGVLALLQYQTRFKIDRDAITKGLQAVQHSGRLQTLNLNNQAWLFDVAHNPQAAQALAEFLSQSPSTKRLAIFSAMADKDMQPMVMAIKPYVEDWVLVDLDIGRAASLADLQEVLRWCRIPEERIQSFATMSFAIEYVKQSEYRDVLVFGSFITVAQAMECICG